MSRRRPRQSSGKRSCLWPNRKVLTIDPGRYDLLELTDGQDFLTCLKRIRRLDSHVRQWLDRGDEFAVIVDFTGGTKCMTAALALQARCWPCRFSYVGGSERTKDGTGIVVSGNERILHDQNPWNALGYQTVDDFVLLFDRCDFGPAINLIRQTQRRVESSATKRELGTLSLLAEAYLAWDRFEHGKAADALEKLRKNLNDLSAVFSESAADTLSDRITRHIEHLSALRGSQTISHPLVVDLLANACRRASEKRFDDAVARLYRVTEALAQMQLREQHEIENTGNVPLERIPVALQTEWSGRVEEGGMRLGLQDAYRLLAELDDDLGRRFQSLQWQDRNRSPLVARNHSILAHGFGPVSEKTYNQLWKGCLELAGITEDQLPVFPCLGKSES
ncbi:MAG: TIGR02710 family CRISPR-associated CARF protein [Pirellulaceae bacterium]